MKKTMGFLCCVFLFFAQMFFWAPKGAKAETIVLKSGKRIEGKIVDKTDTAVTVEVEGLPLTFFWDEVAEPVPPASAPSEAVKSSAPAAESADHPEKDAIIAVIKDYYQRRFEINSPEWLSGVSATYQETMPDGTVIDYKGLKSLLSKRAGSGDVAVLEEFQVEHFNVSQDIVKVGVGFLLKTKSGGKEEVSQQKAQKEVLLKKEDGRWKITNIQRKQKI